MNKYTDMLNSDPMKGIVYGLSIVIAVVIPLIGIVLPLAMK